MLDLVVYWWAGGPVTVDLTAGTATGEGTDTLTGFEWIGGGDYNDTITGDANPNLLWGNGGNDRSPGLDGDDTIYGSDGDDIIDAGNGTDIVDGGSGTNSCLSGEDVTNCESLASNTPYLRLRVRRRVRSPTERSAPASRGW